MQILENFSLYIYILYICNIFYILYLFNLHIYKENQTNYFIYYHNTYIYIYIYNII